MRILSTVALTAGLVFASAASGQATVKGYTLTELGDFLYDASRDPENKTEAQKMVDRLAELGVNQINLSPRAVMTDPRSNELVPRIIWATATTQLR